MKNKLNDIEIKGLLAGKKSFSLKEIKDILAESEEHHTDESLKVRVFRLTTKGIISNIGRGLYKVTDREVFKPEPDATLSTIFHSIHDQFPFLSYLVWNSSWLNQFMYLQGMKNLVIIESKAGTEDSVFRAIRDKTNLNTFINPGLPEYENYISHIDESLIIKTLISESPTQTIKGVRMPRLEKILVDVYCDKLLNTIYEAELKTIFFGAMTEYSINYTRLLGYATRRSRKKEILKFMLEVFPDNEDLKAILEK